MRKEVKGFGMPWEDEYGYAQAVKVDDTIYVSGQLSHDAEGNMVGAAPPDMETQMRQTYANAKKILAKFGATLDDVVEEVLCHRYGQGFRGRRPRAQGSLWVRKTCGRKHDSRNATPRAGGTAHRDQVRREGEGIGCHRTRKYVSPRTLFGVWSCEGVVVESARARQHGHVSDLIHANILVRPVVVTNDQKLCGWSDR